MKLVICLGNPGDRYCNTRHNAGFMFADLLAESLNCNFNNESKFKSQIAKGIYKNEAIWIVKPQTFMNLSGEALQALKSFYKIDIKDLFLVYDDIALDIGIIRIKTRGSDGGHNGVKSIIKYAQTDIFNRLKIGIGPQPVMMKSEDYVLGNFDSMQKEILHKTLVKAVEAFFYYCENDINKVQNKYN
ncbi:MAG: aminoacyl-tRNA hydrolase [Candidatus Gastranaerophilales bacterium]|nr:aminoacyl-tRNA hydrolase [Candidatus Gastranaerophilales bacterium]